MLVSIVVPSFGSLIVVFAQEAHSSPPPWSFTVGCAVVVNPGLYRSGMLLLFCVSRMSFQWAQGKLGGTHLLSKAPASPIVNL